VALTVGGTLVLGLRSQVGGGHGGLEVAATTAMTPSPLTEAGQPAWLGIEGYDQVAAQEDPAAVTTSSGTDETWLTEEPPSDGLDQPPAEAEGDESIDAPVDESTTTLGPPEQPGVVITSVDPTGPAAEALQPGDIVLEVDGEPVTDMDTLLDTLGSYEPGDQVEITYLTLDTGSGDVEGTSTVVVTLGERPADWSVEGGGGQ
jgi:S1-C subfamily serine protease